MVEIIQRDKTSVGTNIWRDKEFGDKTSFWLIFNTYILKTLQNNTLRKSVAAELSVLRRQIFTCYFAGSLHGCHT
jgi:hypothetical protein